LVQSFIHFSDIISRYFTVWGKSFFDGVEDDEDEDDKEGKRM
jgi:hypothetical protein